MKIVSIWHGAMFAEYQKRYLELAKLGHEITLIAPNNWHYGLPKPMQLERLADAPFNIIGLDVSWGHHGATFYYDGIENQLDSLKPDLIECIEEPYGLAAWRIATWRKKFSPKTKLIISTCQNLDKKYFPPFSWFESFCLKQADGLTGLNQESLNVFSKKGYQGPTAVIPTGIDLNIFHPNNRSINPVPVIGNAGRLVEEKGLDTLIEAVSKLKTPVKLIIAGEGKSASSLKKLAAEKSVDVDWQPPIDHNSMPDFYRSIDVFVLPSRTRSFWKEQFGRVIVEAMACGAIVIGSDSGEIPHVIGEAGIVFPEGDAKKLTTSIESILNNKNQITDLQNKGRKRVEDNYTWKAVAVKLSEFIQCLISH